MSQAPLLDHVESEEESIMETFHELAQVLRLPGLGWDFVHSDGATLVEGHPPTETDIGACLSWARFLGMSVASASPESRGDCWLGVNGPWTLDAGRWTLEIVAQVR